jgi:hypothetical protein
MTEIPYEIELSTKQWNELQVACADGGVVTFTCKGRRKTMEEYNA